MELTRRAARVLEVFVAAGHYGVYCTGRGEVAALCERGLLERVERDHYRLSKDGAFFAPRVRVAPPATEEERVSELLESCDGVAHAAFGHPSYRAEGGHLVCLACGVSFSPWVPGAKARAALRSLARTSRTARSTSRSTMPN